MPVLIWEISPRDEFNLDCYEGYPRLYGKEMLEVEMDGKREKMMAYTMTDGYAMGVPSEHYLATIRTGYQEAGFDEDVPVSYTHLLLYHYTRKENLESSLRDGRIRKFCDRETWFTKSLADTLRLMSLTVMQEEMCIRDRYAAPSM